MAKGKKKVINKKLRKFKLIYAGFCALFMLAVCGHILTNYLIDINKKLVTPVLEVNTSAIGSTLKIDKNEGAVYYEFVISKTGADDVVLTTEKNVLDVKSYLSQVGEFNVKARYVGKTDNATSEYSNIVNIVNTDKLNVVDKIYLDGLSKVENTYVTDEDLTDDFLSWQGVDNSQKYYISYINLYNGKQGDLEVESTIIALEDIYTLGIGNYSINIMALSEEGSYYLNSDYSSVINVIYSQKELPAFNLDLNGDSLQFSTKKTSTAKSFNVEISYIDNSFKILELDADKITKVEDGDNINYTADISSETKKQIRSIKIVANASGAYMLNSDEASVSF